MSKIAIYVRISTQEQNINQQIDACVNFCKIKEWNDYTVFSEIQSSKNFRPIFTDVIKKLNNREFNTLVIFRIDRAWRSSRQFILDFDTLQAKGITVVSVMEGLDPSTPMGKAMMTILVALAELEREQISQATKDRLHALKNMGKQLGRPKGSKDKQPGKRPKTGYLLREAKKRGDRNLMEKYQDL
jgi:DNA invertase Pin-like site-specific DNA recombinase